MYEIELYVKQYTKLFLLWCIRLNYTLQETKIIIVLYNE